MEFQHSEVLSEEDCVLIVVYLHDMEDDDYAKEGELKDACGWYEDTEPSRCDSARDDTSFKSVSFGRLKNRRPPIMQWISHSLKRLYEHNITKSRS